MKYWRLFQRVPRKSFLQSNDAQYHYGVSLLLTSPTQPWKRSSRKTATDMCVYLPFNNKWNQIILAMILVEHFILNGFQVIYLLFSLKLCTTPPATVQSKTQITTIPFLWLDPQILKFSVVLSYSAMPNQ